MIQYEYKSEKVNVDEHAWSDEDDKLAKRCNELAKDGWETFSVICPDPRNYLTFRITARRAIAVVKNPTLRRFR